jgi:hypothetical protein
MMIVSSSTSPAARALADEVRAAHQMHLLLAGCRLGLIDRLHEAPAEDETAARRLLCGAVGDHAQRDAPRVLAAPVPGSLVGAAACDHRTVGAHCLLQPGLVLTGRLPARGRVVAPGPAEHPVVQALAADPEPAARAIAGPGDEAVHGDGDPCEHPAHRLSPLTVRPPAAA